MRKKEKYVPNVDLTPEFSRHKSPKGKTDFNGKTTRKETNDGHKVPYEQEVIDLYKIIREEYGVSLFKEQHRSSLMTKINYLLKEIETNPDSPLSILKKNIPQKDFALFIAYIFGGLGDQDSEIDKFNKQIQRNYIRNINLSKYQYCFRYYFQDKYKDYYGCNDLSEFIDFLYPYTSKDFVTIKSLESAIYHYYYMSTQPSAYLEKSIILYDKSFYNNYRDLSEKDSLLALVKIIWNNFSDKPLEEFNKYIDPLLNILHNAMFEFINQLNIFFDRNLYYFSNEEILNYFLANIKDDIKLSRNLISKVTINPQKDFFFSNIAIFEHYITNLHLTNIEKKVKDFTNNVNEIPIDNFQELQFMSTDQYFKDYCDSNKEQYKKFITRNSEIKQSTFNKRMDLLSELDSTLNLNSVYFANYTLPQIRVKIDLKNILHNKVIYEEFFNNCHDSYKFFSNKDGIIENNIRKVIDKHNNYRKNYKDNSNLPWYQMDNSNFDKTITDEYNINDTKSYELTVLLSEKLRRGFYNAANMDKQFAKIVDLKLSILELFDDISSIYDIKKQFEIFDIFLTIFINIMTYNLEMIISEYNQTKKRFIISVKQTL